MHETLDDPNIIQIYIYIYIYILNYEVCQLADMTKAHC